VAKLKRFKRIVLRREKSKRNFGAFVALAAAFIPIKSGHAPRPKWVQTGTLLPAGFLRHSPAFR
jgi:hypothetical protein